MVRDYGDRPPSRRGRKSSFGSANAVSTATATATTTSRHYVPLETRGSTNISGSSGISKVTNMDEYESLRFDNDDPAARNPSVGGRRGTSIQIPELKSSNSSRRHHPESVLVRPQNNSLNTRRTGENPLAKALRLQGSNSTSVSNYSLGQSSRFLQSGLGSTMDQVHKVTEPYAAKKNRARQSRASQSTSGDVLGSALLQTRKPSPKPGPHNTVDLCDHDDDDEDEDDKSPNPASKHSLASLRQRLDRDDTAGSTGNAHSTTHLHEDDAKEMPGYIQTLQQPRTDSREPQGGRAPVPTTLKQPSVSPADASQNSPPHATSGSGETTPPHPRKATSPTISHPAARRRHAHSPTLSQNDTHSSSDQNLTANTPTPSTPTGWEWRRAPAPEQSPPTVTHHSDNLEIKRTTDSAYRKHKHEDQQTNRPKVDFSNVPNSLSKVTEYEHVPIQSPKSKSSMSNSTQFLDGLASSDEEPEPPRKKRMTVLSGVSYMLHNIKSMISPKPKKKEKKIKSTISDGTPTEQLPDDLRAVIEANKSPRDDSSSNGHSLPPANQHHHHKDDSTKLRQMAELLEQDDDWTKSTTIDQPIVTATSKNSYSHPHQRTWIGSQPHDVDSDPEYEPPPQTNRVAKFRLSKANNKVTNNTTSTVRRHHSYGALKPKGTKINPGCTFQREQDTTHVSSMSPRPWREEESPSDFQTPLSTPSTGTSTIQTRSSARLKRKRHQEVVEIDDSDSEIEEVTISQEPIMEMELIRIAIGKKVATAECMARFDPNTCELHLTWKNTKRARTRSDDRGGRDSRTLSLRDGALKEFVVYDANFTSPSTGVESNHDFDHLNSFVAMKIVPTTENLLYRYSKSYLPDHEDPKYRYIILEFRDYAIFSGFVSRSQSKLPGNVEFLRISGDCCAAYASSLLANNQEENKWRQRNKFVAGRALDYKLLVFPFGGDPREIESAADGLTEAARSVIPLDLPTMAAPQQTTKFMETDSDNNEDDETKPRYRAHFVTITVEDYDRLDPGEWLNDSLVDFWMQWISRDDTTLDSKFHFFTSHFFSRLSEEGPEAVASWTRRKKINIFEKKFIFIPINKSMHWSLCLVVNPGAIVEGGDREQTKDDPLSCMIFMDSLRMHNKKNIAETIRNWLNSEWKRMFQDILLDKSTRTGEGPFNSDNFKIFSPRVPLQNNTYDCGVFVCRYAHAVYELRHRNFTYGDAGMYCTDDDGRNGATSKAFKELISDSAEFDFNMDDIARFREEFKILIEKLSTIYLKMKNADKLLELEQKRQLRNTENTSPDPIESEPQSAVAYQDPKCAADTPAAHPLDYSPENSPQHNKKNSNDDYRQNQRLMIGVDGSVRRRGTQRKRSLHNERKIYGNSDDEFSNDAHFGESLTVVNI